MVEIKKVNVKEALKTDIRYQKQFILYLMAYPQYFEAVKKDFDDKNQLKDWDLWDFDKKLDWIEKSYIKELKVNNLLNSHLKKSYRYAWLRKEGRDMIKLLEVMVFDE